MEAVTERATWKTLLAFGIIYFAWGATFLAIRVGVHEVPPFLLASMRFAGAGAALFGWTLVRGERAPRGREWGSILVLAVLIFVVDYGLLFWAEQRVPSGLAAVMLATIPAFMALAEIVLLRTRRLTARLAVALVVGIGGVAVLTVPSFAVLRLGGVAVRGTGALALVVGAMSWSVGSVLTRKLPLPESKAVSSGAQMLAGGVLLAVTSAGLGELRHFDVSAVSRGAWLALLYLIVVGSIIGFTAYLWLLHHESPTKVGTYAYVNPVVAVVLGYFFAGEGMGLRTIVGTVAVLVSVVVITTTRPEKVPVAEVGA